MNLDRSEARVCDTLLQINRGVTWVSRPFLEESTGLPPRTLSNVLKRLVARGVLKRRVTSDLAVLYGLAGLGPESADVQPAVDRAVKHSGIRGRSHIFIEAGLEAH